MKKFRRIIVLILAVLFVLVLAGMLLPAGCHSRGRTFDRQGWTLWRFRYGERHVNLVALNDPSLVVDGVLTIPTRVGTRRIHGFWGGAVGFDPGPGVVRIVIPAEITVNGRFWQFLPSENRPNRSLRYIEFMCNTFEKINFDAWGGVFILIIPDDSTQNFYNHLYRLNRNPERYTFIERTQFLENL